LAFVLLAAGPVSAQFEGISLANPDPAVAEAMRLFRDGQHEQGLVQLRPLAEQGDALAQLLMATILDEGKLVPQDQVQALAWYRKAAAQGVAQAQNELGRALSNGSLPRDDAQAVIWYRKAAEQGHSVAQLNLGIAYWNGTGVSRDHAEAVVWFRKAAEQGLGWGQYYLGSAYHSGLGAPKDSVLAAQWWRKAAEQGYVDAQNDLGALYVKGLGVTRDYARAASWFAQAAQSGNENAAKNLQAVLRKLPASRLRTATEIREKPDAAAAVIRTAAAREQYYELSRSGDWVEICFKPGHALGYVRAELLSNVK